MLLTIRNVSSTSKHISRLGKSEWLKIENWAGPKAQSGNFRILLSLRFYVKSKSPKTAVLTYLEALNFDFY